MTKPSRVTKHGEKTREAILCFSVVPEIHRQKHFFPPKKIPQNMQRLFPKRKKFCTIVKSCQKTHLATLHFPLSMIQKPITPVAVFFSLTWMVVLCVATFAT